MGSRKIQLYLVLFIWASLGCLSSCLSTEISITGEVLESEERVRELFHLWREKHQRVYKHGEETAKRFEIFKNNLKYVIERNSKAKSLGGNKHMLGMNKFADMSNEEFKEKYLSKIKKPMSKKNNYLRRSMQQKKKAAAASCEAPSSLDWRKKGAVTGVKDQGDCGKSYLHPLHFRYFDLNHLINRNKKYPSC